MKRALIVSFAAGIAFMPWSAAAEEGAKHYVGISLGSSFSNHLEKSSNQGTYAENFAKLGETKSNRHDFAGKVFTGIEVFPYLDVRGSLVEMGKVKQRQRAQNVELTQEMRGIYAEGVLKQKFADNRSEIFAKAGVGAASTKAKARSDDASASKSNTGVSLSIGLGYNHTYSNNVGVIFEVERFFTDYKSVNGKSDSLGYKANLYTVGAFYRF